MCDYLAQQLPPDRPLLPPRREEDYSTRISSGGPRFEEAEIESDDEEGLYSSFNRNLVQRPSFVVSVVDIRRLLVAARVNRVEKVRIIALTQPTRQPPSLLTLPPPRQTAQWTRLVQFDSDNF